MNLPTNRMTAVLLALAFSGCSSDVDVDPILGDGFPGDIEIPDIEVPDDVLDPDEDLDGAESAAASIRTELTTVMQSHTWLLALNAEGVAGAEEVLLDLQTHVLADNLAYWAGEPARDRFEQQWERLIVAMIDHDLARQHNDQKGMADAQRRIVASRRAAANVLDELYVGDAGTIDEAMRSWVAATQRATRMLVNDRRGAWRAVDAATREAYDLGLALAIPLDDTLERDGDPRDDSAELRARLTFLLQQDVWLVTTMADPAVLGPEMRSMRRIHRVNVREIANTLGEHYGQTARIHGLWRSMDLALLEYANAVNEGDEKAGLRSLDVAYARADALTGTLAKDGLTEDVLGPAMDTHVQYVTVAMDDLFEDKYYGMWTVNTAVYQAQHLGQAFAFAIAGPLDAD